MSNNNVTINQPNNPYGQPLVDNNKQDKFLGHLLRHSSDIIPAEPIVRNQLRKAEQFTIGGEKVEVPGEYAEAFEALHKFWYTDMLGDYLKKENNGFDNSDYSRDLYLKNWENEIDFFLKNLATACRNRDLSPEYLNILVYNENYGIIHLKEWLVPFCRSCTDVDRILQEPVCKFLVEKRNKTCPDNVCQTQQHWLTLSNPTGGQQQIPFDDISESVNVRNEGANFLLKQALEKYLEKISKSNANSTLSTQELQAIIYNFKIASEQCKRRLPHGANNTLVNENITDIPYDFNYTLPNDKLPNDNPTVTKSGTNIGAVVGGVLGKHSLKDLKNWCKKKENETKKRKIENKKNTTNTANNKGNKTVTVKVGNDQNTLTSKEDFIKNKKEETVNNKDENDIEEEINTKGSNNMGKQGNNSQATGNISNILNKSDLDDIAKQLNAGKDACEKMEEKEKNNKEGKSNNFAERPVLDLEDKSNEERKCV